MDANFCIPYLADTIAKCMEDWEFGTVEHYICVQEKTGTEDQCYKCICRAIELAIGNVEFC